MANYNKKKRKGLAAILVMAIVIVLGGGTAFAYPYLKRHIPQRHRYWLLYRQREKNQSRACRP
ncbi:MAG: hypothetical protein ACLTH3_09580 [Lachnospira sp.]